VTSFDSVADAESYLERFDIRQGDRAAELAWSLSDSRPHEVRIYRSYRSFVSDVDAAGEAGQLLVYQRKGSRARFGDASRNGDIVYRYAPEIAYYYSMFIRADDGRWHLQLRVAAQPHSVGHWERSLEAAK